MHVLKAPALVVALVLSGTAAQAHVTVWPRESVQGAREMYVIRTPNEKRVSTVRLEARFPPEARITGLRQTPGWTLSIDRDAKGAIVGAVWTGDLPPDQFAEFGVLAVNPATASSLTWTFVQTYSDGTIVTWNGPSGSPTPAPAVTLAPSPGPEPHRH